MYTSRHDCWESFWKERVTVNGEVDIEQIKQELFGYKMLLENIKQPQQAIMQPHTIIHLAEQHTKKHEEKVLELA
ncbi:hypothetical protein V7024_22490 [Bacillus sp. JJ864]|uniref:hypothetical protein n=1 Tax=Bacillus sp. JJ864 TaxID=3122975 RepID=UPI002FFF7C39